MSCQAYALLQINSKNFFNSEHLYMYMCIIAVQYFSYLTCTLLIGSCCMHHKTNNIYILHCKRAWWLPFSTFHAAAHILAQTQHLNIIVSICIANSAAPYWLLAVAKKDSIWTKFLVSFLLIVSNVALYIESISDHRPNFTNWNSSFTNKPFM